MKYIILGIFLILIVALVYFQKSPIPSGFTNPTPEQEKMLDRKYKGLAVELYRYSRDHPGVLDREELAMVDDVVINNYGSSGIWVGYSIGLDEIVYRHRLGFLWKLVRLDS
jgi:hypothetical protein